MMTKREIIQHIATMRRAMASIEEALGDDDAPAANKAAERAYQASLEVQWRVSQWAEEWGRP